MNTSTLPRPIIRNDRVKPYSQPYRTGTVLQTFVHNGSDMVEVAWHDNGWTSREYCDELIVL